MIHGIQHCHHDYSTAGTKEEMEMVAKVVIRPKHGEGSRYLSILMQPIIGGDGNRKRKGKGKGKGRGRFVFPKQTGKL